MDISQEIISLSCYANIKKGEVCLRFTTTHHADVIANPHWSLDWSEVNIYIFPKLFWQLCFILWLSDVAEYCYQPTLFLFKFSFFSRSPPLKFNPLGVLSWCIQYSSFCFRRVVSFWSSGSEYTTCIIRNENCFVGVGFHVVWHRFIPFMFCIGQVFFNS